jgi:hypothetical protein
MTVDDFIMRVAQQLRAVIEGDAACSLWMRLSPAEREYWVDLTKQHFMALSFLGLHTATLSALKAGTWKAVPVIPTDEMARPLTRLWLLSDQEPTAEDMQLARQYAAAVIAAAPAKTEARGDK